VRLIWLGVSYILLSTYVSVANLLAGGPLNVLQSTLFAGAIILLTLLATSGSNGSAFNLRALRLPR
jgi:hypothetical protein